jgi:hypothetical protein
MSSSESEAGALWTAARTARSAGCSAIRSAMRTPSSIVRRSSSVARKLCRTRGLAVGTVERSETVPRLVGFVTFGPKDCPSANGTPRPLSW